MKRAALLLIMALPVCAHAQTGAHSTPAVRAQVRPGVEIFLENPPAVVRGKRIGLITNQSGMDRQRHSTIDLISARKDMRIVALFSPEHGIRGVEDRAVSSSVDDKTGLPIYSLYGQTNKPTDQMLDSVDVLVYDIQDLGVRQYTFESTLTLAMETAASKKIPFVVLDRPNPVTGTILEGNILEPAFASFVGIHPVLSRHGMTVGELARYYNGQQKIGANLTVVPVQGWNRNMWFDETGLPWVNPSPNIRTLNAAIDYPGTVFFEAINVSVGRGTDMPFEQIGASWLKNQELANAMNALKLPGIRFEPVEFDIAQGAKLGGEHAKGVRFIITDRNAYRPLDASLRMIDLIRKLQPDQFQWAGANQQGRTLTIDRHAGSASLRQAIEAGTLPQLLADWEKQQKTFAKTRAPYLLYH